MSRAPADVEVVTLDGLNAHRFGGLTFPTYQRLLLSGFGRQRAVAVGIESAGEPAGLGLIELRRDRVAEVRSIFVKQELRGRGLAALLLTELEERVRPLGCTEMHAVFMSSLPSCSAVERLLARCGFESPRLRMYIVRCTHAAIQAAPWLRRTRLGADFEIFPWRELRADERQAMIRRQAETGSLSVEVFPFSFSPDFEPCTSLGLRWHGEVVGWCVNHRYDEQTLRFTCSYLRDDLQKLGRLAAVYARSIEQMPAAGFSQAIWSVPVEFPRMVDFARRHLLPYGTLTAQSLGSRKVLVAAESPPRGT